MGIRENFKRGSIEMLILYLLQQEDMYGYQLAQEINSRSGGLFEITEGSMYPTLYRLIDHGSIKDHKELIGKRRTRVYYHLEEEGKAHLKTLVDEYKSINKGIDKILSSKIDEPTGDAPAKPRTRRKSTKTAKTAK